MSEHDWELFWDDHSASIGTDIDQLSYYAGRVVMEREDFKEAVKPFYDEIKQLRKEN